MDDLRKAYRRIRELEIELETERMAHNKTMGLLLRGEQLRDSMMLRSIMDAPDMVDMERERKRLAARQWE